MVSRLLAQVQSTTPSPLNLTLPNRPEPLVQVAERATASVTAACCMVGPTHHVGTLGERGKCHGVQSVAVIYRDGAAS
jgi:hypothetical protein